MVPRHGWGWGYSGVGEWPAVSGLSAWPRAAAGGGLGFALGVGGVGFSGNKVGGWGVASWSTPHRLAVYWLSV